MFSNPFAPDDVGREKKVQKSSSLSSKKGLGDSNVREPESTLIMKLDMELLEKAKRELNEKQSKATTDSFISSPKSSSTNISFKQPDNSRNPKAELARKIIEVAFKPLVSAESQVCDRFLPERGYYLFDLVVRGNECRPRLIIRDKNEWTHLIKSKQRMDEEAHAIEHVIEILKSHRNVENSVNSNPIDRFEEKQLNTGDLIMQRNSSQRRDEAEQQAPEEE